MKLPFTDFDNYMLERFEGTIQRPDSVCMFTESLKRMNYRGNRDKEEGYWDILCIRQDDKETVSEWAYEIKAHRYDEVYQLDVWREDSLGALLFAKPVSPLEAMLWATVAISRESENTDHALSYAERVLQVYQEPTNLLPRENEALTYEEWRQGV